MAGSGSADGASASRRVSQELAIILDALVGVAVFLVLAWLCTAIERTSFGHNVRSCYEAVAMRVSNVLNPPTPRARIVNIDGLQHGRTVNCRVGDRTTSVVTTDRTMLYAILDGITAGGATPYSIGIDVDFGPCGNDFVVPEDEAFFQHVLQLENQRLRDSTSPRVGPIFLGTFRGARDDPQYWLVNDRYASLAANIAIPDVPGRVVWSIQPDGAPTAGYGMAERLAFPQDALPPQERSAWSLLRDDDEEVSVDDTALRIHLAPVDYRALSTIRDRQISIAPTSPEDARSTLAALARAHMLDGEIVLVAAVHEKADGGFDDSHFVPGFGMQAGPLIHATAANSLRSSRYFLLAPRWRAVLDVGISMFIVVLVAAIRFVHVRKEKVLRRRRLAVILFASAATVMVLLALALLGVARVMWDDVLLLAAFVAIHPFCEIFGLVAARSIRDQSIHVSEIVAYGPAEPSAP